MKLRTPIRTAWLRRAVASMAIAVLGFCYGVAGALRLLTGPAEGPGVVRDGAGARIAGQGVQTGSRPARPRARSSGGAVSGTGTSGPNAPYCRALSAAADT